MAPGGSPPTQCLPALDQEGLKVRCGEGVDAWGHAVGLGCTAAGTSQGLLPPSGSTLTLQPSQGGRQSICGVSGIQLLEAESSALSMLVKACCCLYTTHR